jgi:hypothetical protein
MLRRVWKFPLALRVEQTVELPPGARIVHVGEQGNRPTLWAEFIGPVELAQQAQPHRFYLLATGQELEYGPDGPHVEYRGTVMLNDGALVFHVYQEVCF